MTEQSGRTGDSRLNLPTPRLYCECCSDSSGSSASDVAVIVINAGVEASVQSVITGFRSS